MNVIYRYIERTEGLEELCVKLVDRNEKFIMKSLSIGAYDTEDVYIDHCVKELQLREEFLKTLPRLCKNAYEQSFRFRRGYEHSCKCIDCWISTLSNKDASINMNKGLPKFLQTKSRPDFLK
jgi:hypothetical protein